MSSTRHGGAALSVQYTGWSGTRETRDVPRLGHGARPGRLRGRAAVLRQRHAELRLRRHRRQHRLLHQLRDADPRGPAGADPSTERRRGSSGTARAATSGCPCSTRSPGQAVPYEILPVRRDAAPRQPAGGLARQREQRPGRDDARQQPAEPAAARRRHLLPERRVRRGLPRGPDHADWCATQWPEAAGSRSPTCRRSRRTWRCSTREYFVPLHRAGAAARAGRRAPNPALAALATPGVVEAVGRLATLGLHDADRHPGGLRRRGRRTACSDSPLAPAEISASVAATLYSVWRGQFIRQVIDAPLVGDADAARPAGGDRAAQPAGSASRRRRASARRA